MERLTYDFALGGNHCWQVKGADNLECREVCERQGDVGCKTCPIAKAFDRLAAIEDILGDEYDLDRLRELVEADREQRCFVFRFGFGSIVYRTWIHPSGSPTFITENKMDTLNDLLNTETWDNAYSTRAEAEAALRREQE